MALNTGALKKLTTLPDDPEFIIGIEGKNVPVKVGVTAAKTALGVTALETTVSALPAPPTTAIVNISSAQIKNFNDGGANEIAGLPDLGDDRYIIDRIECRLHFITTPYDFEGGGGNIYLNDFIPGIQNLKIPDLLLQSTSNILTSVIHDRNLNNGLLSTNSTRGFTIGLERSDDQGDPYNFPLTIGDSWIELKIYYTTISF